MEPFLTREQAQTIRAAITGTGDTREPEFAKALSALGKYIDAQEPPKPKYREGQVVRYSASKRTVVLGTPRPIDGKICYVDKAGTYVWEFDIEPLTLADIAGPEGVWRDAVSDAPDSRRLVLVCWQNIFVHIAWYGGKGWNWHPLFTTPNDPSPAPKYWCELPPLPGKEKP